MSEKQKNRSPAQLEHDAKLAETTKARYQTTDNAKFLKHNMTVAALADSERINICEATPEDVMRRTNDYFQLCVDHDVKPSVAGYALAFGVSRQALLKWVNGMTKGIAPDTREQIHRAYQVLNAQMEDYMQSGKINPIAAIFLMKNNMGYEDKTELAVSPGMPLGDEIPAEDLRQKYLKGAENDAENTLPILDEPD